MRIRFLLDNGGLVYDSSSLLAELECNSLPHRGTYVSFNSSEGQLGVFRVNKTIMKSKDVCELLVDLVEAN